MLYQSGKVDVYIYVRTWCNICYLNLRIRKPIFPKTITLVSTVLYHVILRTSITLYQNQINIRHVSKWSSKTLPGDGTTKNIANYVYKLQLKSASTKKNNIFINFTKTSQVFPKLAQYFCTILPTICHGDLI